jgi:hypothetical protein
MSKLTLVVVSGKIDRVGRLHGRSKFSSELVWRSWGHLAVLQWARANGCDWDGFECLEVAPVGSETREWIQAQLV